MEKGLLNSDMGSIVINPEVIASYAGTMACECFGVVGMAALSMRDGIFKLLKQDNIGKGIHVAINNNVISIDFHVILAYGVSINTVCENLIENVTYKVETFTGMKIDKINIFVEGVRVID